eukprot:1130515-Lingulodinium_polyedra.AAC.1
MEAATRAATKTLLYGAISDGGLGMQTGPTRPRNANRLRTPRARDAINQDRARYTLKRAQA